MRLHTVLHNHTEVPDSVNLTLNQDFHLAIFQFQHVPIVSFVAVIYLFSPGPGSNPGSCIAFSCRVKLEQLLSFSSLFVTLASLESRDQLLCSMFLNLGLFVSSTRVV